jgi:transcriptional regulator with XRE-family HTH domain
MSTKHPIADHLEKTGESPEKFGERFGVSKVTVNRWINRRRTPEPTMAQRIENETGIDARELLGIPKRKKTAEGARC